jgi:hypothetical protein
MVELRRCEVRVRRARLSSEAGPCGMDPRLVCVCAIVAGGSTPLTTNVLISRVVECEIGSEPRVGNDPTRSVPTLAFFHLSPSLPPSLPPSLSQNTNITLKSLNNRQIPSSWDRSENLPSD